MGHTDRYGDGHSRIRRKRELEKVSALFELWRKQHPHDTELDWLFYSGRQGIRSRPARHVWDMYRTTTKTGTPYERSLKKPKKTKKHNMTYLPPEKLDTFTVNRMTGYSFNILPLALTIHWVKERGPSRKTLVSLYPTESSFDLFDNGKDGPSTLP